MQEPRVDKEIWLYVSKQALFTLTALKKALKTALKKKKKKMLTIIWQVFGASLIAQPVVCL